MVHTGKHSLALGTLSSSSSIEPPLLTLSSTSSPSAYRSLITSFSEVMADSRPHQGGANTSANRGHRGGRGWRFGRGGRGRGSRGGFPMNEQSVPSDNPDNESPDVASSKNPNHSNRHSQTASRGNHHVENKNSKAPSRASKTSSSRGRGSNRAHNVAKKADIPSAHSHPATDNDNSPLSITYSAKAEDQPKDKPSSSIRADKHTEHRLGKEPSIIKPRSSIQKTKPAAPFQRLPAEVRWKIYQYLFGTYRVDILRQKNKDKSKPAYRLYHRQLYPRNPKSQGTPPPLAASARLLPPPFGLVFTCKSIYCDTLLLLYSKTQFVFHSTRAVTRFLQTTSKDAQASIHHVELNHIMYHEPHLTEFRPFKLRSDIAWYLACEDLSLCLTSLRVLHINQTIWDWPIRLQIGELWSLPLLFFRGLEYADVKLCMSMFKEDKLKQVAKLLEEKIMSAEAYQIREDERLARELRGPVRAKVLKLVF